MEPNFPPNSGSPEPGRPSFAELLVHHLSAGTGLEAFRQRTRKLYREWNSASFVAAMVEQNQPNLDADTFEAWKLGRRRPQRRYLTAMLRTFFPEASAGRGDTPDDAGWRELEAAWEAAERPRPKDGERSSEDPDPAPAWVLPASFQISGLAELVLRRPEPANEPPNSYHLRATLLVSPAPYDHGDRGVVIALREAFLSVGSDAFQTVAGSMVGDGERKHPHCTRAAGGVRITAPCAEGVLNGQVLDDVQVAVIEHRGTGREEVTLTLAASWGSFVVTAADPQASTTVGEPPSVNKSAVLNAILAADHPKDKQGRLIVASACTERVPRP